MRILLAEDDYVTRKFMIGFLSKYGECDVTVDGMEAVDAFMMALEDDEPYEQISDVEENRKEVIVEGMFGKPMASTEGNFIVEGMYGRPKYYIDGDIIRENNQFGRPAYRIDGNYIREGMYGRPKYYIDGDLIRENNQFGRVVGRRRKY